MFEESEEKEERGEVAIASDARGNPILETNQEVINYLLFDVYEVADNILPNIKTKPSLTDNNDLSVYK